MAETTKAPTRVRRSEREVLEDDVTKLEGQAERAAERLAAVKTKLKDARKKLSVLQEAERAGAQEKIDFHEAELARLKALVADQS